MPTKDVLRRIRVDQMTPAELAIRNAMLSVEKTGSDPLLTDAIILLQQARDRVADYVDCRISHGWQWTHERDAELLARDGLMCEQHPGIEWPHNGCAGPGQSWSLEGKERIRSLIEQRSK